VNFAQSHIKEALNISLESINSNLSRFPKNKFFIIHCTRGYRSMITAGIDSIPKSNLIYSNHSNLTPKNN